MSLLILGMHRSGTSAVTELCAAMGAAVTADDDLMGAGEWNQRGHWESEALTAFDEELLAELGGSWDDPPPLPDSWLDGDAGRRRLDDARRLFFGLHPESGWVWKDPRTCLLLPFWRTVFADAPLAAVVCWRDPAETIDSLQRRDGLSVEAAAALWTRYVGDGLADAAGLPVAVMSYDGLLRDPHAAAETIRELGELIGMTLRTEGIDDVIDPGERHSEPVTDELPASVIHLRNTLVELDGLHPAFDGLESDLPWRRPDVQLVTARDRTRRQHAELVDLRAGIVDLRTTAKDFEDEISLRGKVIEEARAELDHRAELLDDLRLENDSRQSVIDDLKSEADRRAEVIESVGAEAAHRLEVIDGLVSELATRSQTIDEIAAESAARLTALAAAEARLRDEVDRRDELTRQIDDLLAAAEATAAEAAAPPPAPSDQQATRLARAVARRALPDSTRARLLDLRRRLQG